MPEQARSDREWRRTTGGQLWRVPMIARRSDEEHRASTPLELFFDLCFVVAVSQAGSRLHHALGEGHVGLALSGFALVFFAIWWAWMNFSWFASAYDNDDGLYRLTTLVQITGVLILAAGVPRAFDQHDFRICVVGYVVMRLAMVAQWLRASRSDHRRRNGCLRYALGISVVQIGWILWLSVPAPWFFTVAAVLGVGELLVPIWAERAAPTTWHREHIAERYGLFTLIVLGESVLAATTAVQSAMDTGVRLPALLEVAGSGLVIVFSMWWLYFGKPVAHLLTTLPRSIMWGYGHALIFASAAAVGSGLQLATDEVVHSVALTSRGVALATAIPVALYVVMVWLLQVTPERAGRLGFVFPVAAILILLAATTPTPLPWIALVLVSLVGLGILYSHRTAPSHPNQSR